MKEKLEKWCAEHYEEAVCMLKALGRLPAPSHCEDERAKFVCDWLKNCGAKQAYIDGAKNVIVRLGPEDSEGLAVVMAHTDIVFRDTEPLPLYEEEGKLYAPGIGDDTANLAALMMAVKYALDQGISPKCGLLVAANSCEEGLGNLKGSRRIFDDFSGKITEMVSLDGSIGHIVNNAVGSKRMRITVKAQGGHSYGDFGNTNAIHIMAGLITALYEIEPPVKAKTTYNAGVIEGGSTVNSICQTCSLLYEYRSESRECLMAMDKMFHETIEKFRKEGADIEVEVLGVRPCKGNVDEEKLNKLTERAKALMLRVTGEAPRTGAGSTDANTALSRGVPSVTYGAIKGGKAHTREEWMELASLKDGMRLAIETLLMYC